MIPAACALVYAMSAGYLMTTDRKLRHYYSGAEIVYFFSIGCVLVSAVPTVVYWTPLETMDWIALLVIGVLGGLAQLCIALAYRRARATLVAQTAYVSVIIAAGYNYVLFDTQPTVRLIVGAILIALGGIYVVLQERKHGAK